MKTYKFWLNDDYFSDEYYEWLKSLLHQLKGVEITEETDEVITATLDDTAMGIITYMKEIDAIPSTVKVEDGKDKASTAVDTIPSQIEIK